MMTKGMKKDLYVQKWFWEGIKKCVI